MISRAQQGIQTAVAFLTMQFQALDEDNWVKLKQVIKYLKATRGIKLTLSVDDLSILKRRIDTHPMQRANIIRVASGTLYLLVKVL